MIAATEPILIDTGLAHDRGPLPDAVASEVDLAALRWIVHTHDDRDHARNLAIPVLRRLHRHRAGGAGR
jgi:flavorubredoxin